MKKNIATILIAFVLFVYPSVTIGSTSIVSDRVESYYIDSPLGSSYYNSINYIEGGCLTEALGAGRRVFKYLDTEIDLDKLISNLRHNTLAYIEHMRWNDYQASAFYASFDKYLQALNEGRLSINVSGIVTDSAGLLTNDPVNYLYNGYYISQTQYSRLSNSQKKKCSNGFYPNKAVAAYINNIAKAMYEKVREDQRKSAAVSSSLKVYNGYQYTVTDIFSDGQEITRGPYKTSITITLDLSKKVIKFVESGITSTYNIIDEPYSGEVGNVVYICSSSSPSYVNPNYAISFFNDGEILFAPVDKRSSRTIYSYKTVRVQ